MLFNTKYNGFPNKLLSSSPQAWLDKLLTQFVHLFPPNGGFFPKTHPVFPVLDEEACSLIH